MLNSVSNQEKLRIRKIVFGERLGQLLGEGADKFGKFDEDWGGGTPLKKGQKAPSENWVREHRVPQPRDENGKYTYNSVNGRTLKYGPSRGVTENPLLKGAKLTAIKEGTKFKFGSNEILIGTGQLDLNDLLSEYVGIGGWEIDPDLLSKKEGRRSKEERTSHETYLGEIDPTKSGETQKEKRKRMYERYKSTFVEKWARKRAMAHEITYNEYLAIYQNPYKQKMLSTDSMKEIVKSVQENGIQKTAKSDLLKQSDNYSESEKQESNKHTESVEEPKVESKEEPKVESKETEEVKEPSKEETSTEETKEEPKEESTKAKEEQPKVESKEPTKEPTKETSKSPTETKEVKEEPKEESKATTSEPKEERPKENAQEPKVESKSTTQEPQIDAKSEPKVEPKKEDTKVEPKENQEKTKVEPTVEPKKEEPQESEENEEVNTPDEKDELEKRFGSELKSKQNVELGTFDLLDEWGVDYEHMTDGELLNVINGVKIRDNLTDYFNSRKGRKVAEALSKFVDEIKNRYGTPLTKGTPLAKFSKFLSRYSLMQLALYEGIDSMNELIKRVNDMYRGLNER